MKTKTVVVFVLIILAFILMLQNSVMMELKLFFWNIYAPMFILVFFIFLIGFLVGFLAARIDRKKDRKALDGRPQTPSKPQS